MSTNINTTKKRLPIYKRMLADFMMNSQGTGKGFCYYIEEVFSTDIRPEDPIQLPELRELWLLKPPKRSCVGDYWFHPESKLSRVKLLEEAIHMAENNLLESNWFLLKLKLRGLFCHRNKR